MDNSGHDPAREAAIVNLRKKGEFRKHLLAYITVNAFLIIIWLFTSPGGFFWPIFPLLGWGIGIVFHAWDVYSGPPSEAEIQKEMQRQSRH